LIFNWIVLPVLCRDCSATRVSN